MEESSSSKPQCFNNNNNQFTWSDYCMSQKITTQFR